MGESPYSIWFVLSPFLQKGLCLWFTCGRAGPGPGGRRFLLLGSDAQGMPEAPFSSSKPLPNHVVLTLRKVRYPFSPYSESRFLPSDDPQQLVLARPSSIQIPQDSPSQPSVSWVCLTSPGSWMAGLPAVIPELQACVPEMPRLSREGRPCRDQTQSPS